MTRLGKLPILIPVLFFTFSAISILAYAKDKHDAVNGNWRTPESTLHFLALAGGWPGALIAQQLFNHKRSKGSFLVVYWMMTIINLALLAWLFTDQGNTIAFQFSVPLEGFIRGLLHGEVH